MKGQNRRVLALSLTAGTMVLAPAAAEAATLTNSGGTLAYSAAAGKTNDVSFNESSSQPGSVFVFRSGGSGGDDDPITATGCTELTPGDAYQCDGVTSLNADAGDGDDQLFAGGLVTITATLAGGTGDDRLLGGARDDTLNLGAGDDGGFGGGGNDTVNGDDGQDSLGGGDGNDSVNGGSGDDGVFGGDGADTVRGGPGIDDTSYDGYGDPSATPPVPASDVSVTLDGQANDGRTGEGDNVTEVEDVFASSCGETRDPTTGICTSPLRVTLVGDAGTNSLGVNEGNGDIDGGAGNDALNGGDNDDTLRARDGFADRVICGRGNDTAIVDTLDTVSTTCENVQTANVGNANEDKPPTVAFAAPAQGAKLGTKAPNTLTATASDDKGIAKVQFLDDERIVCEDTTAPYTCAYNPRGEDVGRNTLVAVAIDTSQQTATAVRTVTVDRFSPTVSLKVTPKTDKRAPFSFKASGKVTPPASVSQALGCADGIVAIQVKAGRKTLSNRRVKLTKSCTFSQKVSFRSRQRFAKNGKLKFTARYAGNDVLDNATSKSTTTSTK